MQLFDIRDQAQLQLFDIRDLVQLQLLPRPGRGLVPIFAAGLAVARRQLSELARPAELERSRQLSELVASWCPARLARGSRSVVRGPWSVARVFRA